MKYLYQTQLDFDLYILPEPVEYDDYEYNDGTEFNNANLVEGNSKYARGRR